MAGLAEGTRASHDGARLLRLATAASVTVAATLLAAKLGAWVLTSSVSMLSSLVDSLMDLAASLINLLAVHQALVPADREHRFGHGKAEPLAGLGQSAFIAGSAIFLLIEAVRRFVEPQPIEHGTLGIAVMVLSLALTAAVVWFQTVVVRRTGSTAIAADRLHYRSDLLAGAAVIAGLVLAGHLGWLWADPLFAVLVAVYILHGAWTIARRALDLLMDRELPNDQRERIRSIALAHPGVRGLHDLRTRSSGVQPFIQFHLVLDAELSLLQAHHIADEIEGRVKLAFPGAEVIIHQDPEGYESPPQELPE
jgi:ferrous-iron efflux pump FieF